MGISDHERIEKAAWAANRITKLAHTLTPSHDDWDNYETRVPVERLKKLCFDLIPTMSATKGNGAFWLLGLDTEVGSDKVTPFSMALYDRIKYAMTPEARKELNAKKKKPDLWGKEITKDEHKLFEVNGYLSSQAETVFSIYTWCHQFTYATNRYDDNLSTSYHEANSKIVHIINECFNIFEMEEQFAIAYLKAELFPLLLGATKYSKYEKWDVLTKYIVKNHYIYRLRNFGKKWDEFKIDTLKQWITRLKTKNTARDRFWIWIKLIAADFDSNHKKAELIDLCKKLGISYPTMVEPLINKAVKEKKESSEIHSKEYQSDKEWRQNDLLERTTDSFHFIWNEKE
jgi:hypothetical protein